MALAFAICAGLLLGIIQLGITGTIGQAAQDLPGAMALAPEGQTTLGDVVWNDSDMNGLQTLNEPGINLVRVKLYQDNNDGVFDPTVDPLLGEMVTGDNPNTPIQETGWYQFLIYDTSTLYWVVIDESNFVPGGSLTGYSLTSANAFGSNPMLVFLSGVQDYSNADFGYAYTGIVDTATPTPTLVATLTNTPTSPPSKTPTQGFSPTPSDPQRRLVADSVQNDRAEPSLPPHNHWASANADANTDADADVDANTNTDADADVNTDTDTSSNNYTDADADAYRVAA